MPFLRGETMAVTEWDLVEYGQRQREYKQKRNYPIHAIRWEVDGLTLDEVIARAYELYPNRIVTPTAARTWVARDMLPAPTIQSFGRGKGTRAHYPVDTVAQMATAAAMMDLGYTQREIAQARQVVVDGVPVDDMPDVVALLESGQEIHDNLAVVRIAEAVRRYALTLATARAGRNVTRPLSGFFHKRTWEKNGVQMFACFVSELGYYIDPRGKDDITGIAADLDRQIRQEREEIRKNRKNDF
jgi:hypothetical protein